MINILLLLITIVALGGMVFCNSKHKKGSKYQLIALGLLALVLISGGLFMYRIDTLALLGLQSKEEFTEHAEQKFDQARAFKTTEFITANCPKKGKILIVIANRNRNFSGFLTSYLNDKKYSVEVENIQSPVANEDPAKFKKELNDALTKYKNLRAVVIAGLGSEGIELVDIPLYKLPAEKRPAIIFIGATALEKTLYRHMKDGLLSAAILTDAHKNYSAEKLSDDPAEVFDCRFTLIEKSNLERNKSFFGL